MSQTTAYPRIDPTSSISEIGEKRLIRDVVAPLLNPSLDPDSVGDDCAVIHIQAGDVVCASTDRVPADLVSFRLGILDYGGLGNYLAVLNLSDLAAMGATPLALLLNLGLPAELTVRDFRALLKGAQRACQAAGCRIVGGDLSSSSELSISATAIGAAPAGKVLRRAGAMVGDDIYCTTTVGLSATAFAYFLRAQPRGFQLPHAEEEFLKDCFRKPSPKLDIGKTLAGAGYRVTAMDNTDGLAQSLLEIAEKTGCGMMLFAGSLPIHDITRKVAAALGKDPIDVALGPGADFQLVGTIDPQAKCDRSLSGRLDCIGRVVAEPGIWANENGVVREVAVCGWDYYSELESDHHLPLLGSSH